MDAKRNDAKGSQPREGKATQMEGPDLESVIGRAQGQDAEELGEIYRLYVRRVFGLCRYIFDSRDSAEDSTSYVFLFLMIPLPPRSTLLPYTTRFLPVAEAKNSAH